MKTVTLGLAGGLLMINPWGVIHHVAILYEFESAVGEMKSNFSWLTLGVGVLIGVMLKLAYDRRTEARYREFVAWMERYERRSRKPGAKK